jgi:hypothetical protein
MRNVNAREQLITRWGSFKGLFSRLMKGGMIVSNMTALRNLDVKQSV